MKSQQFYSYCDFYYCQVRFEILKEEINHQKWLKCEIVQGQEGESAKMERRSSAFIRKLKNRVKDFKLSYYEVLCLQPH